MVELFRILQANIIAIIYNWFTGKPMKILFYQGFPRPIFPTQHTERSEGCFVGKIGGVIPWLSIILVSQNSSCTQFDRLLRCNARYFHENFAKRILILIDCPNGR